MRKVEGSMGVELVECVNPKKDKWRIRWDVRETDGGGASYMEEEFGHKPTEEDVVRLMEASDTGMRAAELERMGRILGYGGGFVERLEGCRAARISADPLLQLMEVVREQHLAAADIPDAVALRVPATFFSFAELCRRGEQVAKGVVLRYGGKTWRVVQSHTPQEVYPPGMDTAALYAKIEPGHAGTKDDPIPYEQGMAFEKGKYYSQHGVVYECILTTQTGYPHDLKDLPTIAERVEG